MIAALVMKRRRLLPGTDLTLHLGRTESFLRLNDAYSANREIFVASEDGARLARTGVVASIVTLVRTPVASWQRRDAATTEDRVLLKGVRRARILDRDADRDARELSIESLAEPLPANDSRGVEAEGGALLDLERHLRQFDSLHYATHGSALTTQDILSTGDPVLRIYRMAWRASVSSEIRQSLLEAESLLHKAAILEEALRDLLDLRILHQRVMRRFR